MAGYIIHLAIANEYYKIHQSEIDNYSDFISGIIDLDVNKTNHDWKQTHIFNPSGKTPTSYEIGNLLHIVTDKIFYKKFIYSESIYEDYNKTNSYFKEKYNVKIPEIIENEIKYIDGTPENFSVQNIDKFIDEVANLNIFEYYNNFIKNQDTSQE